jgi:hypothetical protein
LQRSVFHQSYVDFIAIAGESFIDRVVDDFIDQVVETAFSGGADIHSGALANGVEALKDGDRAGVVTVGLFGHSKLLHKIRFWA